MVVAVLYGSFRALGGGEAVPAEDYRGLLLRLAEYTSTRAGELSEALAAPAPAGGREAATNAGGRVADPLVETAASARKKLGGYLQQLNRVESSAGGEERDRLEGSRTLLAAGAEDLAWACRLIEGGTYRDNTGLQRAVAELREHATQCLEAVNRLLPAEGART